MAAVTIHNVATFSCLPDVGETGLRVVCHLLGSSKPMSFACYATVVLEKQNEMLFVVGLAAAIARFAAIIKLMRFAGYVAMVLEKQDEGSLLLAWQQQAQELRSLCRHGNILVPCVRETGRGFIVVGLAAAIAALPPWH